MKIRKGDVIQSDNGMLVVVVDAPPIPFFNCTVIVVDSVDTDDILCVGSVTQHYQWEVIDNVGDDQW